MKLAGSAPKPTAPTAPTAPAAPIDDTPPADAGIGGKAPAPSEKPFDDEPFDAGVEADEASDPKKFIEQLTGKLGQSLRKYSEEQGQPDFELEKFAINSLLSATHTSEMDADDQDDIVKKVKEAGNKEEAAPDAGGEEPATDQTSSEEPNAGGEDLNFSAEGLDENLFLENPPKNNMFQPNSNDILDESGGCWDGYERVAGTEKGAKGSCKKIKEESKGLWANIHAKKERGEAPAKPGDKDYPDKKQWNKLTKEGEEMGETNNYMFWSNLKTIVHATGELMKMDSGKIDSILTDGHGWALDHMATSNDDIEEVYHFLEGQINYQGADANTMNEHEGESNNYMFWQNLKTMHHGAKEMLEMDPAKIDSILSNGHGWALDHVATATDDVEEVYHFLETEIDSYDGDTQGGYSDEYGSVQNVAMNEAEYQGRTVKLGKPMKGDVKKFKVFVKNKAGKVVKVNFGDPNMEIKRDNPERRKSFRARHKCSQAHDRTTPKYWSCRMWSKTPVSKMVEDLSESKKSSIFGKDYFIVKLHETFAKEETMSEPMIKPQVKPITKPSPDKVQPNIAPSRKNKPFLPMPNVQPAPKALKEGKFDYETYHKTLAATLDEIRRYTESRGYDPIEFDVFEVEHVGYGTTRKIQKELSIGGVPKKNKYLNAQIYRMDSGTYELNMYVG